MNFMEAVKAMKESKKVRRSVWESKDYFWIKNGDDIVDIYGNLKPISIFDCQNDLEATDWEIVDEYKDWNLADERMYRVSGALIKERDKNRCESEISYEYSIDDVKKCRELILEDINNTPLFNPGVMKRNIRQIVNKRFGDLK